VLTNVPLAVNGPLAPQIMVPLLPEWLRSAPAQFRNVVYHHFWDNAVEGQPDLKSMVPAELVGTEARSSPVAGPAPR